MFVMQNFTVAAVHLLLELPREGPCIGDALRKTWSLEREMDDAVHAAMLAVVVRRCLVLVSPLLRSSFRLPSSVQRAYSHAHRDWFVPPLPVHDAIRHLRVRPKHFRSQAWRPDGVARIEIEKRFGLPLRLAYASTLRALFTRPTAGLAGAVDDARERLRHVQLDWKKMSVLSLQFYDVQNSTTAITPICIRFVGCLASLLKRTAQPVLVDTDAPHVIPALRKALLPLRVVEAPTITKNTHGRSAPPSVARWWMFAHAKHRVGTLNRMLTRLALQMHRMTDATLVDVACNSQMPCRNATA